MFFVLFQHYSLVVICTTWTGYLDVAVFMLLFYNVGRSTADNLQITLADPGVGAQKKQIPPPPLNKR